MFKDSYLRRLKFINYLIKISAQDGIPCLVCNFQGLHLGLNIEGDADVAGDFFIFFQVLVEVTRSISVPEKGDMAKLDCLTAFIREEDTSNIWSSDVLLTFRLHSDDMSQDKSQ